MLSGHRFGAIDKAEQQIADALQGDSEFHAGQQQSGFIGGYLGDGGGHKVVDIAVQRIQLALAVAHLAEHGFGGGGNAFGGRGGGPVADAKRIERQLQKVRPGDRQYV